MYIQTGCTGLTDEKDLVVIEEANAIIAQYEDRQNVEESKDA